MNFLFSVPAYVWLLISATFFAIGEYLSKKWGAHPSFAFAVFVVLVYAMGTFAWLPALLHKNQLAIMGTAWLLLVMAATVGVGLIVFHEKVSPYQTIGIVLAGIALVMLNL